jgi:hypothetical protein
VAAVTEPARLLAARSEFGYTDRMDKALRDEPEAVSSEEQRRLTRQASLEAQARARQDWGARYQRLRLELADLHAQPYSKGLGSELRLMERQLAKLDRLVGLAIH